MIAHFNLYDSPHYGIQLNHLDNETYEKYLKGEDEDVQDFNVIDLNLEPNIIYWVSIPDDYASANPTQIGLYPYQITNQPGNYVFLLRWSNDHWESQFV